jgi:hypothetical protein
MVANAVYYLYFDRPLPYFLLIYDVHALAQMPRLQTPYQES